MSEISTRTLSTNSSITSFNLRLSHSISRVLHGLAFSVTFVQSAGKRARVLAALMSETERTPLSNPAIYQKSDFLDESAEKTIGGPRSSRGNAYERRQFGLLEVVDPVPRERCSGGQNRRTARQRRV
jgi:hypothetical protein